MTAAKTIVRLKQRPDICKQCHARHLCLSASLDAKDLQQFDDIVGHPAPIKKGERLYIAGDKLNAIYVLHSGSVKSYVESSSGENQITGFHLPGDVIGLNGVDHHIHGDCVEALETSSVCEIQFDKFEDICISFPGLQKQLSRYVFREISHEQTLLLVLGKLSAESKIAYFLLGIASSHKQRGLCLNRFHLSMTRRDIANYLGVAIETVSRVFTKLQKSNVLMADRRSIEILDFEHLRALYHNNPIDTEHLSSRA